MKVKIFVFLVCYSISRAPNSLQYMKTRISLLSSVHLLVEHFVNLYPFKAACSIFLFLKLNCKLYSEPIQLPTLHPIFTSPWSFPTCAVSHVFLVFYDFGTSEELCWVILQTALSLDLSDVFSRLDGGFEVSARNLHRSDASSVYRAGGSRCQHVSFWWWQPWLLGLRCVCRIFTVRWRTPFVINVYLGERLWGSMGVICDLMFLLCAHRGRWCVFNKTLLL